MTTAREDTQELHSVEKGAHLIANRFFSALSKAKHAQQGRGVGKEGVVRGNILGKILHLVSYKLTGTSEIV